MKVLSARIVLEEEEERIPGIAPAEEMGSMSLIVSSAAQSSLSHWDSANTWSLKI